MKAIYEEIGSRIRLYRKAKNLTQAHAAEAAGIETSFYGQVERGVNIPSLKTLYAVAEALSVEVTDLLPTKRGSKETQAYAKAVERLLQGLPPEKRRLALDVLSDMVSRLKR